MVSRSREKECFGAEGSPGGSSAEALVDLEIAEYFNSFSEDEDANERLVDFALRFGA